MYFMCAVNPCVHSWCKAPWQWSAGLHYGGASRDCLALWISQPLLGVGNPINLRNYTRLHRDLIINLVPCKVIGVPRQFETRPVGKSITNMSGRDLYERTIYSSSYTQSCTQPTSVDPLIQMYGYQTHPSLLWWTDECNVHKKVTSR